MQTMMCGSKARMALTVAVVLSRSISEIELPSLNGGSPASYPDPTSQGTASTRVK